MAFMDLYGPWIKEFAWTPKIIKGKFFWLTYVYKREKNIFIIPGGGHEYGTLFDVLRDS